MAAITISWDPTAPADGDTLTSGNEAIQAVKTGASQRLRNGGHSWDATAGATTTETDGRHCCGMAFATGSAAELAGELTIYYTNKSTAHTVFRDSASAAAIAAGNLSGELFTALTIRTTDILKGTRVEVAEILRPAAVADNGVADNVVDIGVDATNRFRNLYLGGDAKIGGTLLVTGLATFTTGLSFSTLTITTQLTINGGQKSAISSVSSGPVTLTSSNRILLADPTAATIVVNLPAATTTGIEYWIHIIAAAQGSANFVNLTPASGERIDTGIANAVFGMRRNTTGDFIGVHLISNGAGRWEILTVRRF